MCVCLSVSVRVASGLMDAMFDHPLGGFQDSSDYREQLQQQLEASMGENTGGRFNTPGESSVRQREPTKCVVPRAQAGHCCRGER